MNWAKQHESTGGKLIIDWESLHARFRAENGNNPAQTPPEQERQEAQQDQPPLPEIVRARE